jgi:hypothetical protein
MVQRMVRKLCPKQYKLHFLEPYIISFSSTVWTFEAKQGEHGTNDGLGQMLLEPVERY